MYSTTVVVEVKEKRSFVHKCCLGIFTDCYLSSHDMKKLFHSRE
jgi:hypothetical protein